MFNSLQIILFVAATLAMFYMVIKVGHVFALIARYGSVIVRPSLYFMWALCIAIEIAFVLSLTQDWTMHDALLRLGLRSS